METLSGKVAFVTGGASGVGLGMVRAFLDQGMSVAMADVDQAALDAAKSLLDADRVIALSCDVTDAASVDAAAEAVLARFGKVHVVCSNAGINPFGRLDDIRLADWRWVFEVNVMGIVHGVKTFLPILQAQGEGGHFVHTASAVGLALPPVASGAFSPYLASKCAAVGLSEKLAYELAPMGLGVSILCPSFVRSNLTNSDRLRPDRHDEGAAPVSEAERDRHRALLSAGMDPAEIGARVVSAIRRNDLYVVPHPQIRADVERRFGEILAAFDEQA